MKNIKLTASQWVALDALYDHGPLDDAGLLVYVGNARNVTMAALRARGLVRYYAGPQHWKITLPGIELAEAARKAEQPATVNPDNTLTVAYLLRAVADGRVSPEMPLGLILRGQTRVLGVDAFEVHTYSDGTRVFVMHAESTQRPVATRPGETAAEVGL